MNIIGHEKQQLFLNQLLANGRLPQAIIFSGLDGLGKKMVALDWVRRLLCPQRGQHNIELCPYCSQAEKLTHPDLRLIQPETREIKIDQIRGLQSQTILSPALGNIKIFIIDQAHTLNYQAQNCFLKTLEEPTGACLFILITSQPDALLPTIRSRCFQLKFYPLPNEALAGLIHDQSRAETLLEMAQGCPGRLMSLQTDNQLAALERQQKECERLVAGDLIVRFKIIKKIMTPNTGPFDLSEYLLTLVCYLSVRIKNMLSAAPDQAIANQSVEPYWKMMKQTEELRQLSLGVNLNPRLALENLMLSF